jgi:S-DNA-T family DNA segregation ATPase FtsK/SpoIIIE
MNPKQDRTLYVVRDQASAPALPLPGAPGASPDVQDEREPDVLEGKVLATRPAGQGSLRQAAARTTAAAALERLQPALPAGRALLGVAVTIGQGGHSWWVRAWDALTLGVYRRQIRAAEALGDHQLLADWLERRRQAHAERHARLMDLPRKAVGLAKLAAGAAVTVPVLLAGTSTLVWAVGAGEWLTIPKAVAAVIRAVFGAVGFISTPVMVAAPVALIVAAWREGRRRGTTPRWLTAPSQRRHDADAPITPSIVVIALRDLGIAALRQAIKQMGDAGAAMLGPIRPAGCGVEVDVTLPSGVSTEEVQKRRRKLAENLGRHEHEVFITIPAAARTVRLWIADPGALDEPIGPSPLALDPDLTADLYTGRAPWGQDLRGDAAAVSLFQLMVLVTGLSNQGKTAALRALALWLALDTTVEFRVADLKGVGDWRMFDGLATVLIQGPTDEHVAAATEMVEEAVRVMEARTAALEQSGATDGITRQMARTNPMFKPLVLIVDEAQVAFMCPAVGEDRRPYGGTKHTSRYYNAVRKIHNQGRAVNVVLWQGTQDPTDQNLPKVVREGAHLRASLAVGTEEQARMALGDAAVDGGAAPHKLRQGLDKGTLVTNGGGMKLAPGQGSVTIRTHFISGQQAAEIAERAKARRNQVTTLSAVMAGDQVNPYADIAAVIGDEPRMPTQEVLQRLTVHNPAVYRGWTHGDLKRVLDEVGAGPYKSDGRMVVGRDRVLRALSESQENPADDSAG